MKIYVLDDEPFALRGTIKTIQEVVPEAEISGFGRAKDAMAQAAATDMKSDVVFNLGTVYPELPTRFLTQ